MNSAHFIHFKSTPTSFNHKSNILPTNNLISSGLLSNSFPKLAPVIHDLSFSTRASIPRPVSEAYLEDPDDNTDDKEQLKLLRLKLKEIGIECGSCRPGQTYSLNCPMCNGGDSGEKKLALFIADDGNAVWTCFRAKCGWKGSTGVKIYHYFIFFLPLSLFEYFFQGLIMLQGSADVKSSYNRMNKLTKVKKIKEITERELKLEPLCHDLCEYFAERMISKETLQRNSVMQRRYENQIVIAFTYRRKGELISCKYRDLAKHFWQVLSLIYFCMLKDALFKKLKMVSFYMQETDTQKILYGLDDIEGARDVIIVEGEMDKLAMEEAGFRNCVSVPDGAPQKVSSKDLPSQEQDIKYQYLWNCKEYLEKASRIILATDGDQPGQALAEELARRLGRERCWRVTWPRKNENEHFKDANEVLMFMGPSVLREVIESAELYPIKGLFSFKNYLAEIDAYYHQTLGTEIGISTGWKAMDDLYNVVPGELTIVTGVPNSGKSEWIDALLCNLNQSNDWKFALCSMENKVREHARKLLEKRMKKPFFDVRYGKSVERMSKEELEEGKKWLSDTFHLIRCENDCLPSISWVLGLAKAAVLRHGVNGLVIDPYNELDHQRPPNQTETEYVSQMLTSIKRFAQHHSCHVWFVAHPKQRSRGGCTGPGAGTVLFIN
ncbi:hypothetical protein E3N88_32300 [Mikania micrantha]|uniref:SF4 helicase domain-containing protein n=1 Tax=Mikania micrantha TaxID=192012 RepID=A0A5N6M8K5_9ASTR|nr:hypothetical protein E3N88_32281 [Mikania micrantha]KAD3336781.1 hypothetical protein E3N88_32300 [Mikania micrantha]